MFLALGLDLGFGFLGLGLDLGLGLCRLRFIGLARPIDSYFMHTYLIR
jgi:hypothetical protein